MPKQRDEPGAALLVVVGEVPQDSFRGFGKRAVVFLSDVLLSLKVGAKFSAQALVVSEPREYVAAFGTAFEYAFAVVVEFIVVVERSDERHEQRSIRPIPNRVQIAEPIEREVHFVNWIAVLSLLFEHVIEHQLAEKFRLLSAREIDRLDFAVDVAFFVGKEKVQVAIAADERFFFQPCKAVFNLATEGEPVRVDFVDTECDEVVDVSLNLFHVADEEQRLKQRDIEGLKAGIVFCLIDGLLDGCIEKALNRWVEPIERHKDANILQGNLLACRLKSVKDRAFAAR